MAKISIIVLQYNQSNSTLACLESLANLKYPDFNVIVVDNASEIEHLKNAEYWIGLRNREGISNYKLLVSNENLGYSGGNNIGIKYALERKTDHILILNNDVVVETNFLDQLLQSNADVVGVEERVVFGFQHLSGVVLFVRRGVFEKIGFLDERYFLYYEDVEFSVRARKAGLRLELVKADFQHAVSASTSSLGSANLLYYHTRNALLLNKTHGSWYVKLALPFWKFWIKLKQHVKLIFDVNPEISKAILQGVNDYDHHRFGMRIK